MVSFFRLEPELGKKLQEKFAYDFQQAAAAIEYAIKQWFHDDFGVMLLTDIFVPLLILGFLLMGAEIVTRPLMVEIVSGIV